MPTNDLHRLASGTLLVPFAGQTAPGWLLQELSRGLAGVVLFGFNIEGPSQLAGLTSVLRAYGDPIISLDEEGGDVTRITHMSGSPYPGNAALGVIDDPSLTERVYAALGADLVRAGINLNMAPSADVNTADDNPVIGTRSFGADASLVARHTVAAVHGLQSSGVAACVKHFPGHGATRQDSHHEVPTVDIPLDLLEQRELHPFRAAIGAGVRSVMTAHVRVPALTGTVPATLSPEAVNGLLRDRMGYDGVVITDALEMKAISDTVGIAHGAVLSLAAGSDLLCLGAEQGPDVVAEVRHTIMAAVQSGVLPLARLEEAAARTAELSEWLHTAPQALTADDAVGLEAARRAVRLTGAPAPLINPLVVEVETPPTIAVGDVPWGLAPFLTQAEVVRIDPTVAEAEIILERANERSLILVVKDAHRHPATQKIVSALLTGRPDATVVEMGLPVWRPGSAAYLATYGAARPNARAAAELLQAP